MAFFVVLVLIVCLPRNESYIISWYFYDISNQNMHGLHKMYAIFKLLFTNCESLFLNQ